MKKYLKNTGGITLISLVITIIILLILAAISIQAITNTGIFAQANNAKRESEIANIKEQIALDIYEKQLVPPLGSITDEQLETILGKYGTVNKEDGTIVGITTEKGYEILLKDIYGGETVAESVPESVPDGATVTPVNDITTWLKTGEISNQYSYTTIEQVIADSTCTQNLMKNENAMKYLARSTEFANAICASETTMTALGQSAYVDDTVLNSDLWISKISSSSYWDLIYPSVTVHSSASATITVAGKSFTSDASGDTTHSMPWGTFTISDSVSGQSFEYTIGRDTTDVYVMPKGALYWYGNECTWITGGWQTGIPKFSTFTMHTNTKNTNDMFVQLNNTVRGQSSYCVVSTINNIDISGVTTLNIIEKNVSTSTSEFADCIFFSRYLYNTSVRWNDYVFRQYDCSANQETIATKSFDILNDSKIKIKNDDIETTNIGFGYGGAAGGDVRTTGGTLYAAWLE